MAQDHFARAKHLCEVVGAQADTPLRLIEAELLSHRPTEPRVGAAFRRPGSFDQPTKHDAVDVGQTRLDGAEDAHTRVGLRRRPYLEAGEHRGEKLGIVGRIDHEIGGSFAGGEFIERFGELGAVGAGKGGFVAALPRQGGHHVAVARDDLAEPMRLVGAALKRQKGGAELDDEIGGARQLAFAERDARIGRMQFRGFLAPEFFQFGAEGLERVRETVAAGTWARPAQDGALKCGGGTPVGVQTQ